MKQILTLLCLTLTTGTSAFAKDTSFFPFPLTVSRLPNGLTVARVRFPSPGLVAYYSVVRVGSRNEVEPGHTGFAHFFEHIMFKGTERFPGGKRQELLSQLGFNDNAFTTDDITVFHSFGPSTGLKKLIEVESDRFAHLAYSEATFQTEAKAVLGEYLKGAAHPEQKIEEVLAATAFQRHPYRHTTIGFYDDIQKMPGEYAYSREFFKRWYTPNNTFVFVVGDFDDAKLMQWMKEHYGPWHGSAAKVTIPSEPPQKEPRKAHIQWPTPTLPRLVQAWHTPGSRVDSIAGPIQTLLGAYLVGPTSATYQELVLQKQLAESVSSGFADHRDPQLFTLQAVVKNQTDVATVQKTLESAVQKLVSGKVDRRRLEEIKSNQRYGLLMSLETADHVALQLAYLAGITGDAQALIRYEENLRVVGPPELIHFAKTYLVPGNRTILTLTPGQEREKGAQP